MTTETSNARRDVMAWADLPWRAAAGWLRSASGSKIMEVGTHNFCISQRESELIAAAVNSYATAPPASVPVSELEKLADSIRRRYREGASASLWNEYQKGRASAFEAVADELTALAQQPAAARGDVPYDRDLIARMLDVCGHPKFTLEAYMEQARLLREADNAAVANVGTVAARGHVRGLVAKLAAHVRPTCSELWDEAQAFLAAEGVQAGEVEGGAWTDADMQKPWGAEAASLRHLADDPALNTAQAAMLRHCAKRIESTAGIQLRALADMLDPAKQAGVLRDAADALPEVAQQPAAVAAAENVRRLVGKLDQWRHCMSHNESYFGEPAGLVKSVSEGLARAIDPIYPPKSEPGDPLAGVTVRTASVPFATQHQEPKS